jgi:hypothetical protein
LLERDDVTGTAQPGFFRLLLAIAANEIEPGLEETEALAAKAVARAPALLLRALDRLETAGWKFEELGLPSFAPVVQRFRALLKKCDFVLRGESDRCRLQECTRNRREFSNVLISGFDGAHWSEWFALRTAVELAKSATIVLEEPRGNFSDVDLCWIGSWEEVCGEAQRTSRVTPGAALGDSLFSEMEMRGGAKPTKHYDFLIGTNFSEQAEAITRQCVGYLADEKCTRLGVIFAGRGALPRLVASSLERLEIPHNDGLGHIVPGLFESAEWEAWIELQRAPRLSSFLRFLNALPDPGVVSGKIPRQVFERTLNEGYQEVLLDDLELLREFCAASIDDKSRAAAEALRALPFLPARATFAEFLEQTHIALAHLGWKQHALELNNRADQPQSLDVKFSRALFLSWLKETAATSDAERSATGDHPYARLQLLTVARAQNQEWSHLIFAGWNEGAWPPATGAEFARAEEIRAFNQSVQQLNERAARQGSQGEGHTSVREDHSLYLGPSEQRAIALRQFDALLESASECVTLTASLVQEDAPERFWNPSELFTDLYLKTRGEPLTQKTLQNLQLATARLPKPAGVTDVQQTLIAFKARRDSATTAGEYDFALRPNQAHRRVPTLSVSDLQLMVSSPAIVWMKRYLGVEAPEDTANPWAATTGKWVHHWLAKIIETRNGNIFSAFPTLAKIDQRICLAADERYAALQQLCRLAGKVVPDWWISGWLNARYLARHLGAKIGATKGWNWMATELLVGRHGMVKIANGVDLQLHGRIDLVLAQDNASSFAGEKIWVVDYKTGSTKELKTSDLHDSLVKGTTLQLGLYALAMRELGAAEVSASIVALTVKNVAPQLSVIDLTPHTDIFADLSKMQRTGIFGMKAEIRPAFGYSARYPLATLPIDNDILEDRWALTHPALVLEREEWEAW